MQEFHRPVLLKQVLENLKPKSGQTIIDATFGAGGHSRKILEVIGPKGKLIAIDWDENFLKVTKPGFKNFQNIRFELGNYVTVLKKLIKKKVIANRILFDLGMSSWHLMHSGRGFSFQKNEFLDMRYNKNNQLTAWEIVNKWPEKDIEWILRNYGGESRSRLIAESIIKQRKQKIINTTKELTEIIWRIYKIRRSKINPATKTFQALRLAVNRELENVKEGIIEAIKILKPTGRIIVVSFHEGEDRIVKNLFKEKAREKILKILTKPIKPSVEEIKQNPRSRSAKLRVAEKI